MRSLILGIAVVCVTRASGLLEDAGPNATEACRVETQLKPADRYTCTDLKEFPALNSFSSNARVIVMDSNNITQIPELGKGNYLPNLQDLYLSQNPITSIAEGTFIGMEELLILDLSSNQLSGTLGPIFEGLTNVETIYLYKNLFDSIEMGILDKLTKLRLFDISQNRLSLFPGGLFEHQPGLQFIYADDIPTLLAITTNLTSAITYIEEVDIKSDIIFGYTQIDEFLNTTLVVNCTSSDYPTKLIYKGFYCCGTRDADSCPQNVKTLIDKEGPAVTSSSAVPTTPTTPTTPQKNSTIMSDTTKAAKQKKDKDGQSLTIIIVVISVFVVALILILVVVAKKRKKASGPRYENQVDQQEMSSTA
eukprot:m.298736 g.298736  ORF g.298736 m.298736 type:complete len:363 (+) comp16410_c0_seq5:117-1205(+)